MYTYYIYNICWYILVFVEECTICLNYIAYSSVYNVAVVVFRTTIPSTLIFFRLMTISSVTFEHPLCSVTDRNLFYANKNTMVHCKFHWWKGERIKCYSFYFEVQDSFLHHHEHFNEYQSDVIHWIKEIFFVFFTGLFSNFCIHHTFYGCNCNCNKHECFRFERGERDYYDEQLVPKIIC